MSDTHTRPDAPVSARLAALHAAGAAQRDPLGWHHAEALARRSQQHSGATRELLEARLSRLLDALTQRLPATQDAQGSHDSHPTAGPTPGPSALAQLLQDRQVSPAGRSAERVRVQQFREQLQQIRVHRQVRQAIAQAPQNAGPINSHMLVLRALGLMRDISPAYLQRFMAHVDTLLCLEEATRAKPPARKAAPRGKR